LTDRQHRALARLQAKGDFTVRPLRMDDFHAEVDRFFKIYNSAWARNWGFAPMTEAEVKHLAKDLKRIIDPDLVLIVEKAGNPVGVSLILPDANQPMAKVRSGRLLPTGWWHLLRGLKKTTQVRVIALGVSPEVQSRAIGPLLYAKILDDLSDHPRYDTLEASWILADNKPMNAPIQSAGGELYKTWRMYKRKASP
jgi:hypothetical protein